MSGQAPPRDDERDRRLGEAIDGYLEQAQQGEPVSVEDWVRRYPDIAEELRECLAALPLVRRASQRGSPAGTASWPPGSPPDAPSDDLAESPAGVPPRPVLAGYTLLEEIGRGGMGLVYRALQHATKRLVAVKFLASGAYASPTARRRFAHEVEFAAGLDHPGIVRVLEAGESTAGVYCAMELVEGDPLHVYLARRDLSVAEKLRLFLQIVQAVHYAHLRAVIHRDLKPSNIMVDREGHPRVLDFGLARFAPERDAQDEASRVTPNGQLVGTLPYLSPEQAAGTPAELDIRSDLYALGVILYEMLTGELPYETGGPLTAVLDNICHTIPPRPSQFCGGLSTDIDAVVLKTLEKSKEDRYQSTAELAEDVRCCLRGEPAQANRSSRFYLLRKAYARHRTQVRLAAAGLSLVLVVSAVILALYIQVQRERDRLAEQLHISVLQHGLANLAAGHDHMAEHLLWSAYIDRPDPRAYWSLLSYYVQNPLLDARSVSGWITCLTCSPDNRLLAYGTLEGTITIRDEASFDIAWSTEAHSGGVSRLEFSPDGNLLATGGADGRIRLWRSDARELVRELDAHPGGVTQLRFADSQERLMSAGQDGRVLLWELGKDMPAQSGGHATRRTIFTDEEGRPIVASDLSSSGRLVAVGMPAGSVRIVEADSGEQQGNVVTSAPRGRRDAKSLMEFSQAVEAVRFSPDERTLAVWSHAEVSLWDWAAATRLWVRDAGLPEPRPTSLWDVSPTPHLSWKPSVEFSSDGALLVLAGWDAVVRMWRPASGNALGELRSHGTAVYALAFQADSHRLVTSYLGAIRLWDLDHHPATLSRKVSPGMARTCVAVSGRAGLMAWGDAPQGSGGAVYVMKITPPRDVTTWQAHPSPVEAVAFGPDGRCLATGDRHGSVAIWDVANQERLRSWRTDSQRVRALAFSPDGTRIASGDLAGELQVRSAADGSLEQSWPAHRGLILAVSYSPDGKRLASTGTDWRARVWELGRHEPVGERQHDEWVNAVAFSPDGERLATASADLSIHIGWPPAPPDVKIARAHAHWVNAVAFLDQGRVLVSGGNDGAIRFWDARNGQELATLSSLGGPVDTLAVTRDERFLAIGAARAVQLMDLGAAADLIRQKALPSH